MPRLLTPPTNPTSVVTPLPPPGIVDKIAAIPDKRTGSLWQGPDGDGWCGGITQSMLGDYLTCQERFRIKYVLGLRPADQWSKAMGYGSMWHVCEEALAKQPQEYCDRIDISSWAEALSKHTHDQMTRYPMQRPEIAKWDAVCRVQFPEYIKFWSEHPDVVDRQPLMQEQAFDVPYRLPSGRKVRLRGKFDSVDLVPSQGGIYLQENKTKGDIDPVAVQRQLKFDLQTMVYLVALELWDWRQTCDIMDDKSPVSIWKNQPLCGVRYNIVRRPLSGGKGSIRPHAAKTTKTKSTPAESDAEFYERLRKDYIAAEPEYWFVRFISRVSASDIMEFRRTFLDPVLEDLSDDWAWWAWCLKRGHDHYDYCMRAEVFPIHTKRHHRHPFGVYNSMDDGGSTEYDSYLESGIESGLHQTDSMFEELKEAP